MLSIFSFFEVFLDPLYRGPLLGTVLMSFSTALIGALMFVRKKSLIGETISHATFPGVALGVLCAGTLSPKSESFSFFCVLLGAFVCGILGFYFVELLISRQKKTDSALCFILSSFLAVGVLLTSYIQQTHVTWYRKIQIFFYGQSATMTDFHVWIYGALSLLTLLVVFLFFRAIKVISFDQGFSKSLGISTGLIEQLVILLFVLSIVVGIRSVGIVLITGMLLAPSIAARSFCKKFNAFVIAASLIGVFSSIIANYLALREISFLQNKALPAGPLAVVCASIIALLSLIFSPSRGSFFNAWRRWNYQRGCIEENILKCLWKSKEKKITFEQLKNKGLADILILYFSLYRLLKQGFIKKDREGFFLSNDGRKKADYIIRLHRLWELYLIEYLSSQIERVHKSAEEIEHLITPDLEKKLTKALLDPNQDPHEQPIPPKDYL